MMLCQMYNYRGVIADKERMQNKIQSEETLDMRETLCNAQNIVN